MFGEGEILKLSCCRTTLGKENIHEGMNDRWATYFAGTIAGYWTVPLGYKRVENIIIIIETCYT